MRRLKWKHLKVKGNKSYKDTHLVMTYVSPCSNINSQISFRGKKETILEVDQKSLMCLECDIIINIINIIPHCFKGGKLLSKLEFINCYIYYISSFLHKY